MRVLNGDDIRRLVTIADLIEPIAAAMMGVSQREAQLPLRQAVPLGGQDKFGVMPGALGGDASYGAKLLSLFPRNPDRGLSSHSGVMLLFDRKTGLPRACLDASVLTALRTAAASAAATRLLARPDARRLAIIGAGEEAEGHLVAMRAVRPLDTMAVWSRNRDKTEAFARKHDIVAAPTMAAALADADIICTTTSATEPFLAAAMIPEGAHLNAVGGSMPYLRELLPDCVSTLGFFTDYRPSLEAQAGEVIDARAAGLVPPDWQATEIGEVIAGTRHGRTGETQRTVYRSLGVASQDLAAADFIVARATECGRGVDVAWQ
ncbi:MAG: ornithine cyclodeaminase [Rhodospirillum sp.]|nr:ornithine cyclodeaminase [Rhodospirillum sp.]